MRVSLASMGAGMGAAIRRLGAHDAEEGHMMWMLPYSTLMLVLMILFAALYSISLGQSSEFERSISQAFGGKGQSDQAARELALADDLREFVSSLRSDGIAEVSVTAHAIKLNLASPVVFESGSAELKPDIMPLLLRLYHHLKDMDNTIVVEGHTDNVPVLGGAYRSNWELSASRAFGVIRFYLDRGFPPERLVAYGYGEHRPRFSNATELGRAINRRIEITVLRKDVPL